jgi:predicted nucleotidyltransferase component of viral defense system
MNFQELINQVLSKLNENDKTPFILKGGTALLACYGLDRQSEDIDLDAAGESYSASRHLLFDQVENLAREYGCQTRIAKDTEAVQRIMINYGATKPLKVELSLRRLSIPEDRITTINGIKVYTLDELFQMKAAAYLNRDKIRDLYDVTFIINNHFEKLSGSSLGLARNAFAEKDLSQFDYLMKTQDDPLVDKDRLASAFLEAYGRLGLMSDSIITDL